MKIPVAHDFTCPWCWIGLFQAKQLKAEYGVEFEWLGYELFPDELEWPERLPMPPPDPRRPPTPSRLELAYAAQVMEAPTAPRPKRMRSHNAHEAMEFAKTVGAVDELNERLYFAYWERGLEINDPDVIVNLAKGLIDDLGDLRSSIVERRFKHQIVGFDAPAYESGIFNVPTFIIAGQKYAEQPYTVLKRAMDSSLVPR